MYVSVRTLACTIPLTLALLGCKPEVEPDPEVECTAESELSDASVFGRFYFDADGADSSRYASEYDASGDAPLAETNVQLIGAQETMETTTCDDGTFSFDSLEDGAYVLNPTFPDSNCLQRNCPQRFPAAVMEGNVKLVTVGDSVPVIGDAPMFPDRLATLIGDLAEVENTNIAVAGSLSTQWTPGTSNFDSKLAPHIEDADVIIISVGGNDITNSLDASALMDIDQAIEDTYALVADIAGNIRLMVEEIREQNPDVDIVYCLYVDYGMATISPWGLLANFVPEGTVTNILASARDQVPSDKNIILADLFGASHTLENPLDDYLYDSLHFNDQGQTMYAQEVFESLGGVLIGESPLGGDPQTPLNTRPSWSFEAN